MKYNLEAFIKQAEEFQANQQLLANVVIEILPQENELDPYFALTIYKGKGELAERVDLADKLVLGKTVIFTNMINNQELHRFTHTVGTPMQDHFKEVPWLFDMFLSMCFGLLIKKLTPPLLNSGIEGRPADLNDPAKAIPLKTVQILDT